MSSKLMRTTSSTTEDTSDRSSLSQSPMSELDSDLYGRDRQGRLTTSQSTPEKLRSLRSKSSDQLPVGSHSPPHSAVNDERRFSGPDLETRHDRKLSSSTIPEEVEERRQRRLSAGSSVRKLFQRMSPQPALAQVVDTEPPESLSRSGSGSSLDTMKPGVLSRGTSADKISRKETASPTLSRSGDLLHHQKHRRNTSRSSMDMKDVIKETSIVTKDYDEEGRKMINNYLIMEELGRGKHGKVKRCYDTNSPEKTVYAMKIVKKYKKKTIGMSQEDPMQKIKREIAILKKCDHENVVRLHEVIDDPAQEKVYLVLEYIEKGTIEWQIDGRPAMNENTARQFFRDVLLGLEYLHYNGIVHRDIKPANLLLSNEHHVKISDFGVSYITQNSNEDETNLQKTAGSPAFFAPEICAVGEGPAKPIGKAIDIWALGVTLYCFIYGRTPFWAESEYDLYDKIHNDEVTFGDDVPASASVKDLILRMMEKNPLTRATIPEIKSHPWVTADLKNPKEWIESTDPTRLATLTVSDAEMSKAFTFLSSIKKHMRRLSDSFRSVFTRKASVSSDSSHSLPSTPGSRPSSFGAPVSPRINPLSPTSPVLEEEEEGDLLGESEVGPDGQTGWRISAWSPTGGFASQQTKN